jgi:hypothetical protein
MPFGPTHWCQPVVTMHHVEPHEMNQLANFELGRNTTASIAGFEASVSKANDKSRIL